MPVFPKEQLSIEDCPCCDGNTLIAQGSVRTGQGPDTDYWVRWSEKHPEIPMLFVVTEPKTKRPVASLYSIELESFMIVEPDNEFVDLGMLENTLCRDEVIGTPVAQNIFAYLDEIFLNHQAVNEFASTPISPPKSALDSVHIRVFLAIIAATMIYLVIR